MIPKWSERMHNPPTPQPEPAEPDYLTVLCEVEDALHKLEVLCDDYNIVYPVWFVHALDGVRADIMKVEAGTGTDGDA